MSYFSKSSNLFSIRSAIEEFKQVILVQNQVITNLQTALNASVLRVDALETAIAANTTELEATNRTVLSNTTNLSNTMTTIGNLQPVVASHTASLATLQSQVTTNTSDLTAKTTQISVINSIQGGHTTSIGVNYNEIFRLNGVSLNHATLLAGLRTDVDSGSGSQADIAALQSDVSTINTTLTLHDERISYNLSVFLGFLGASQSLVLRLNAVEADISTINTTLAAHDSRIFTNTTDIFQLQTNGHEGRLDSAEATVLTLVTDVGANTTLVNNLLLGLQIFGRSITAVEADITTLRTDVDANTLSNTQLLNALQYQSTSIFAIDTAIQGLNVQVGNLETTYNAHIDGAFLAIRQNVDDNNAILGTLSTHTTSLLTAMSQLVPRVEDLEAYHP
jgi:chromosome segregation ATPase